MQKWQYRIVNFGVNLSAQLKIARWDLEVDGVKTKSEGDTVAYLDLLGSEGWQLVSTNNGTDATGNITKIIAFFQRPAGEFEAGAETGDRSSESSSFRTVTPERHVPPSGK